MECRGDSSRTELLQLQLPGHAMCLSGAVDSSSFPSGNEGKIRESEWREKSPQLSLRAAPASLVVDRDHME